MADYTEEDRRQAIRHLSAALLEVWLQTSDPSSPANRRRRAAITEKLQKWGRKSR